MIEVAVTIVCGVEAQSFSNKMRFSTNALLKCGHWVRWTSQGARW